jgi:hypothetical protein
MLYKLLEIAMMNADQKRANLRSSPMASNKIDVFFCGRTRQYCLRTEFARLMLRTLTWKRTGRQARSE